MDVSWPWEACFLISTRTSRSTWKCRHETVDLRTIPHTTLSSCVDIPFESLFFLQEPLVSTGSHRAATGWPGCSLKDRTTHTRLMLLRTPHDLYSSNQSAAVLHKVVIEHSSRNTLPALGPVMFLRHKRLWWSIDESHASMILRFKDHAGICALSCELI